MPVTRYGYRYPNPTPDPDPGPGTRYNARPQGGCMKRFVTRRGYCLVADVACRASSVHRPTDASTSISNTRRCPIRRSRPTASQIIYTRGWIDKQADRRESSLWIMNADGSKNRFLVSGSNAAGRRPAIASPTPRRASRAASQIFVRYMDAEGADVANHARRESAERHRLVARRHPDRLHHERRREEPPGRSRCRARPRAQAGSRRRASSSASTIARMAPASTTTPIGISSSSPRPAARRGS